MKILFRVRVIKQIDVELTRGRERGMGGGGGMRAREIDRNRECD